LRKEPGIYILLFPNGKHYIGQSTDLRKRVNKHLRGDCHQVVGAACIKYGRENIKIEEFYCPVEMLDDMEIQLIKEWKNRGTGSYNYDSGGHANHQLCDESREKIRLALTGKPGTRLGKKNTPEANARIGDANRGRTMGEEAKEKMSRAKSFDKHPNYGKQLSEETRKRISEALTGLTRSEETRKKLSDVANRRWAKISA